MHTFAKFSLIVTLLAGVFGCSGPAPEQAAAEARVAVTEARARVADADARVRLAIALVDAANADAGVASTTRVAPDTAGTTAGSGVVIPSGTRFQISLIDALDSGTSSAGDRFLASLSESIVVNGVTVLPAGTTVRGRVVDVKSAGRVQGLAAISLALTDVVRGDQLTSITTDWFAVTAKSTKTRDAEIPAGAGGVGNGVVPSTRGEEIRYAPETRLTFTLMNPVSM